MNKIISLVILAGIIAGIYYYHNHQAQLAALSAGANSAKDSIVDTAVTDTDAAIKNAVASVDKISLLYYADNRNYGVSAAQNICYDATSNDSLGAIIADIGTYTKAVTCTVNPVYPSTSFTLTAPSVANQGHYYCTDQSGFAGLIPDISGSSSFEAGLKCT